jgi:hypothetical protein
MKKYLKSLFVSIILLLAFLNTNAQTYISSFVPTSGKIGSVVTLNGYFSSIPSKNMVFFGTIRANVLTAASDKLTVEVPIGATSNNISLCLNNTYSSTNSQFYVTYSASNASLNTTSYDDFSALNLPYTPACFAHGDLDNDGLVDLIVACNSDTAVYVYKNTNDVRGKINNANFEKVVKLKASTSIAAIRLGDLDADGKLDILVLNQSLNTFSIFKNIGRKSFLNQTSFATKIDFTTGASPSSMTLCDINSDYKVDIVVANYNDNTLSIFQNRSNFGVLNTSTFLGKFELQTGEQPIDVVALDQDKLVTANFGNNSIMVFKKKASVGNLKFLTTDTCFTNFDLYITKGQPSALSIVDIDNDNRNDILVTNQDAASFSIFKNITNGNGIFDLGDRIDFLSNSLPRSMAIGDLNGDAKPDMLIANATTGNVSVFQNNAVKFANFSNNTLLAKVDFNQASQPLGVIVADFDNDGRPDFATLDVSAKQISFRRNKMAGVIGVNGNFNSVHLKAGKDAPIQSCTVNAKGLGINALTIVPSGLNVQISTQQDAGFSTNAIILDPIEDTIATTTIYMKVVGANTKGNYVGKINFTSPDCISQTLVFGISNAIPRVDSVIPAAAALGEIVSLLGIDFGINKANVKVNFGGVKGEVVSVNDSVITVKVPVGASNTNVLVNIAGYQSYTTNRFYPTFLEGNFLNKYCFASAINYNTSAYPLSIVNADYNEDGKQDFIFNHGNGLGMFTNKSTINKIDSAFKNNNYLTLNSMQMITADIDGDNRSDLLLNNTYSPNWSIFRNKVNSDSLTLEGNFDTQVIFNTYGFKAGLACSDLDMDGKIDVLASNNGTNSSESINQNINNANTISVFANKSSVGVINVASLKSVFDLQTLDYPSSVYVGDLNGDRKPDIVGVNKSNVLSIFQNDLVYGNNETNYFLAPINMTIDNKPSDIEIVDINLDGTNDIVLTNPNMGLVQIYLNLNEGGAITTSSFSSPINLNVGGEPNALAVADFDGDARPDIVVANYNSSSVSLFKNISIGGALSAASFQSKVDFIVGDSPYDVKVVDIDGDGKPEIITSNSGGVSLNINLPVISTISVLRNLVNPDATGIENHIYAETPFVVYPNPASSHFNIKLTSNDVINSVALIDLTGNEIKHWDHIQLDSMVIGTENIPKGLYFVKVVASNGVGIQKIKIH